jgi:hypothetical protein
MTPAASPVHQRNGAIESMRDDPDHLVRHGQLCTKRSQPSRMPSIDFLKAPQAALALLNVVVRSLLHYCARVARER